MAMNHVCTGKVLNFTNTTDALISSGQLIVVGDIVGVATVDIPAQSSGVVSISEVWELPKASGELAQGLKVYLDTDSASITATAAENTYAGIVYEAALTDAVTVSVRING